ncbi:MAG: hypothetical protein AB8B85_02300 [Paracoccaceae bacterium]
MKTLITIKPAQQTKLNQTEHCRFVSGASRYLRKRYADRAAFLDDDALNTWIEEGIQAARNYDIQSEMDVLQFLGIRLTLGADLNTSDMCIWAADILASPLPAQARMDMITERMAFDPACKPPPPHE